MAHYIIELSHSKEECLQALTTIVNLGMHIGHHTWWGCGSGVHTGWLDLEVDSESDARGVIPPAIRSQARLVEVHRFTPEEVRNLHQ